MNVGEEWKKERNNDDGFVMVEYVKLLNQWVTAILYNDGADYFYPESKIGTHCCTTGTPEHEYVKGVHAKFHWVDKEITPEEDDGTVPVTHPPASVEIYSIDVDNVTGVYADMGLEWELNKCVGYDGADNLPAEIAAALKHMGYDVSEVEEKA